MQAIKKNKKRYDLIYNWRRYIMALPALTLFALFSYATLPGIWLSFTNYTVNGGIFGSEFAGLNNYKIFFESADVVRLLLNSIAINIVSLLLSTSITIALAILLNELFSAKLQKVYQFLIFVPYFLSIIVAAKFTDILFGSNGIINKLQESIGVKTTNFYSQPDSFFWIYIFSMIWKSGGYGIVLYFASIIGFDQTMYEAAKIDGANRWHRIVHITLPHLIPTIITILLLSAAGMFSSNYIAIYTFTGDNPALQPRMDVIETYLFRNLSGKGTFKSYGVNGAVSMFQSLLNFVTLMLINGIVRLIDKDKALF